MTQPKADGPGGLCPVCERVSTEPAPDRGWTRAVRGECHSRAWLDHDCHVIGYELAMRLLRDGERERNELQMLLVGTKDALDEEKMEGLKWEQARGFTVAALKEAERGLEGWKAAAFRMKELLDLANGERDAAAAAVDAYFGPGAFTRATSAGQPALAKDEP